MRNLKSVRELRALEAVIAAGLEDDPEFRSEIFALAVEGRAHGLTCGLLCVDRYMTSDAKRDEVLFTVRS